MAVAPLYLADKSALARLHHPAVSCRLGPLVDRPAPGTGFLAVEGDGEAVTVSIWSYLYGPDGAAAAARDDPPLAPAADQPRRCAGRLTELAGSRQEVRRE